MVCLTFLLFYASPKSLICGINNHSLMSHLAAPPILPRTLPREAPNWWADGKKLEATHTNYLNILIKFLPDGNQERGALTFAPLKMRQNKNLSHFCDFYSPINYFDEIFGSILKLKCDESCLLQQFDDLLSEKKLISQVVLGEKSLFLHNRIHVLHKNTKIVQ